MKNTSAAQSLPQNSPQNARQNSAHGDQRSNKIPEQYLISPFWDLFLVGGGSMLMFLLANLFFKADLPDASVGWFVFNLSYLVNFPHFLVSYQILYNDFRGEIFKKPRFFWAAVVSPLLLIGVLVYAFAAKQPVVLGYMVNAMYFFVGWHYVKQIFGCISVSNAINRFYYSSAERFVLKSNLFSLWGLSYVSQNIGAQSYDMEGVKYLTFDFPAILPSIAIGCVALSGVAVLGMHVKRYIRDGRVPSRTAMAAFLTIYVWYIPTLYHPMFFHMIPFFHSLQYLLFVYKLPPQQSECGQSRSRLGRVSKELGQGCIWISGLGYDHRGAFVSDHSAIYRWTSVGGSNGVWSNRCGFCCYDLHQYSSLLYRQCHLAGSECGYGKNICSPI